MAVKFAIYSIDITATLDPWNASPQPAILIDLAEEPLLQTYDYEAGSRGRGTRIQTLGGAFDQDFGHQEEDELIRIAAANVPFTTAQATALINAFNAVGINYYFTDTVQCWMVKFVKPNGLNLKRNMLWKYHGEDVFSYDISLKVNSKAI